MNFFDKFLKIRELGIFSIIVVFVIAASIIDPRFMTVDSWRAVFLAIPLILVMAMGQMMVIICRHVDISIGSILAFSAIVIGLNNSIQIFDRYGLKVFDMENYTNTEFTGVASTNNFVIAKEKGLPSGVYFYILSLKDIGLDFQGFLYLTTPLN